MGFREYRRRTAMVLVILLPALLACTDADVIGTSTGILGLSLQSVGGAGRYDVSVLQITGLIILFFWPRLALWLPSIAY